MVQAAGVRVPWSVLPAHVRSAVQDILGSPVVRAVTQPGGFSPGSADRVVTADGRCGFVKAVAGSVHPVAAQLHRREAVVTAALPAWAPVPRLLASWEEPGDAGDGWVVLVLSDVEGRHPALPWRRDELDAVRAAFEALAAVPCADGLAHLPATAALYAEDLAGWQRLRDEPDPALEPWARQHLDRLVATAAGAEVALQGDQLVHGDARADNLLVRPDGSVVVVDWPWASRGVAWFDRVSLLVNVGLYDEHAPLEDLVHAWLPTVADHEVDGVLAGVAGFFCDAARRPAPPGLPTLRAFQRAQATVVLRWLRQRWG